MIRAFALIAILLTPQDDLSKRVDDVLSRLNDDSVEVRDGALRDLVGLGPAALPLLQARLESLEGEARGRVQEACRRIETAAALAKVLPPLRKVTLDLKERPVKEVLDEIARQSGLAIDPSTYTVDGTTSLALQDATPLQALDALCRASKAMHYQIQESDDEGFGLRRGKRGGPPPGARIVLQPGGWTDFPSAYVRHYRVQVQQVSLNKVNGFDGVQRTGHVSLDLKWPPEVKPDRILRFRISELKDDQGRSLLEKEDGDDQAFFRDRIRRGWGIGAQHSLQFKYPEAGAKAIGLLRGEVVVEYPKEVRTVAFEKPAESKGKTLELDGLKLVLKDYRSDGKGHTAVLEMTGRLKSAGAEQDRHGYPFSWEDVEAIGESGERLSPAGMSGSGGNNQYTWTLNYRGSKTEAAQSIRITCVLTRHSDEMKFELKNIPFPD
jgi:hypothetical protein